MKSAPGTARVDVRHSSPCSTELIAMHQRTWLGVAVLMVGLASPGWAQRPAGYPDKANPLMKAAAANRQLTLDLRDAQDLLKNIPDRRTRERLELLLTRAELRAVDVQKELAALAAASRPTAVPELEFAKILAALKGQSFDKDKVLFVENLGSARYFTSAQARALLKEFSFDDGRGKAAVALYPQVIDPDNFATVLEVFTFDSGRKTVREKLKLK